MAKISVIIPVYNTEKYLARCFESILNQNFTDMEVILVDDGSTDNSPSLCDEYAARDNRVRVVHQPNAGVSNARNHGLEIAHGEFIHFADSDDFLEGNFYQDLYNLAQSSGADVCCSVYSLETKNGDFVPATTKEELLIMSREDALTALLSARRVSYSLCDKIFKRDVIKDVKFNEEISHNEDYVFCYEAIKRANIVAYTSQLYYRYCNNPTSTVRSAFSHKRMTAIDAHEYVLNDIKNNIGTLYRFAKAQYCKVVLYTRELMKEANYNEPDDVARLENTIRRNLVFIMFSRLAVGYKLLAIRYAAKSILRHG